MINRRQFIKRGALFVPAFHIFVPRLTANRVVNRAAAPGGGYLINEGFEGAGTPTGWSKDETGGGTVDFNATVDPLEELQSLRITGTTTTFVFATATFAPQSTWGVYCIFQYSGQPSSTSVFVSVGDGTTTFCDVRVHNSTADRLVFTPAGDSTDNMNGFAPNTTWHMWLDGQKGTGADGVVSCFLSSTPTKPGSPSGTSSVATFTTDATTLRFFSNSRGQGPITVDTVKVAAVALGDGGALP